MKNKKENKSGFIAFRVDEKTHERFLKASEELGLSGSRLMRYMMLYCMRLNVDATGWELKEDFKAMVRKEKARSLFC